MATKGQNRKQWIALGVLAILCVWLVNRNLLSPREPEVLASLPRLEPSAEQTLAPEDRGAGTSRSLPTLPERQRGQRGRTDREEWAALDPTLRLDLLERSRRVQYESSARNIFQVYTPPPPKPLANPVVAPVPRQQPPPVPVLNIPLKFYGVAARPGTVQKKAFLTDGEEIFIVQEGDLVAKFYKIVRIGVNSIELEDSRSQQRQTLPLQEEQGF